MSRSRSVAGFTMIELLLSLGLFSLLLIGLLQLLDTSTDLWRRVEFRRERTEVSAAFSARLERDLSTLEAGPEGDFFADWILLDVDGNGLASLPLARLRFVRRASPREVARLREAQTPEPLGTPELVDPAAEPDWARADRGLVEVAWVLSSTDSKTFEGRLLRGERFLDDPERLSLFDPRVFSATGRPIPGLFEELSMGVLWMEMAFASQATQTDPTVGDVRRWKVGGAPSDGASSWDAWGLGRPKQDVTELNAPAVGLAPIGKLPALPRRVRVAFEVQPERDRIRRTSLQDGIEFDTASFLVLDGRRLPEPGGYLLIDEEWMKLLTITGERATVLRGERGTTPAPHKSSAMVWYGWRTEIEVPIGVAREDWDL